MKKMLYGLGAITTLAAPAVVAVSCAPHHGHHGMHGHRGYHSNIDIDLTNENHSLKDAIHKIQADLDRNLKTDGSGTMEFSIVIRLLTKEADKKFNIKEFKIEKEFTRDQVVAKVTELAKAIGFNDSSAAILFKIPDPTTK